MYTASNLFQSSVAPAPGDDLSYAEAFPPLPTATSAGSAGNGSDTLIPGSPTDSARNLWGKKMSLRSSTTTQVIVTTTHVCVTTISLAKAYVYASITDM